MEINKKPYSGAKDHKEEIASLVRTFHETQRRLVELTDGEIDAVPLPGGQSYLLQEAQERLRQSEMAQRQLADLNSSILNSLLAHIALIDETGVIISVNDGWLSFAENNGLQTSFSGPGQNYLEVCERTQGEGAEEAQETVAGIRSVLNGTAEKFELEYPCHSLTERRWFRLVVTPLTKKEGI
jgi:PAS domain-containing protein